MHARNPRTHQHTSGDHSGHTHVLPAHDVQCDDRREDGCEQRHQNGRPVISDGDRQDVRQHSKVVHRPDAGPHRTGPTQQPHRAGRADRSRYASRQIQGSVRRNDGDQHRERHERVVVRANQVHGSLVKLEMSVCCAAALGLARRRAGVRGTEQAGRMPLGTTARLPLVSSGEGNSEMHGPRLLWRYNQPAIRNYAVAVVLTAVALGIARWLDVHLESAPVSLFLCAVMLSAWLGGVGPGLLAAALCAAAFSYYFVSPIFSLAVDSKEIPRFVMFLLASVLVGSLSVTQRRAMQSLRKAEAALRETQAALAQVTRVMTMGELAASIAHEVNQPLAGVVINGNACLRWLAGESPNLPEAREAAQRIIRDGTRASEIISRIRALAKKTSALNERVDLNEAIREVLTLCQGEAVKHDVALRERLPGDLPSVRGDRVLIQQVVLNLVMNGIEAMRDPQDHARELVIGARAEAERVRVTVRDSGIGLDPQAMERIFDALYTTKPGGLGMGLSISRTIVENHGGRLSVVAHDGPGTTFEFTLPAYA